MKYRPAVRIAIRLIGVYLLAGGIPEVFRFLAHAVREATWATGNPNPAPWIYLYPTLSVVRVAIAVYLILGAPAIVNWVVPPGHFYCPGCGFDLGRSAPATECPECGGSVVRPGA